MTEATQTGLLDDYQVPEGCRDELIDDNGEPRPHAGPLIAALERLGPEALAAAGRRRDRIFMQQGITFEVAGTDGERRDRPFPLDLVPRVLPAQEWTTIKRGLAQRIRALNAFVDDVYHAHEIVRAGIVPWSLVVSRPSFARPVHGVRPPGGVYCHVSGCDLVRGGDGRWRVLEDNVRTPSGISYVLENRVAMTRLMPELFAGHRVRPVDHYPGLLLDALRAVAPAVDADPTVVVWTPGPANSAYFEHAFIARQMGVELVEASDLVVRDATCYMRTTAGLERVHSIYRRLDDDYIDPLEFRPDSLLGVPGLVRAYRAGTVAIANAIGTGVADDKAIYHYVPEMIRFYLSEEPILDNVPTFLLGDEATRRAVVARIDELVVKPTSESGGKGVFIGPHASAAECEAQARRIEAEPERWIAQELVHLSTVPTETEDGGLVPRHVDLRPFAVFGDEIRIVPGGLTRVALRAGSMVVNSSQGGGSKDTWVLDDGSAVDLVPGTLPAQRPPPRLPDVRYGGWRGQAQQQQQQGAIDTNPRFPSGKSR
ncbi:MAG: circularly permuted type 2 ATP-grasp protein [Actinomycetota bacterium]|nr:circularly permuted type 2 ATP-grasp protein [Actinomycetota bacterium]